MNHFRTLTATALAAMAITTAGITGADAAWDRTTRSTGAAGARLLCTGVAFGIPA